jgi:UDP-2,3-diacylglucosamine hydrolase
VDARKPPSSPFTDSLVESRPVAYFLSDVHLGGGDDASEAIKRERLGALLDRVERDEAALFILGDLFDFWFEYHTVIPRAAFSALASLDRLAGSGLPVRYLGGNHDFWLRDFLRRDTHIEVLADGARVEAQGRRLRLYHGDGLGPGDTGYKVLKRILRNPLAIRLYRWVHPDLGIPFALRTSGVSRHHTGKRVIDVEGLFTHVAVPAFGEGADAVLMGHHHVPIHWQRPEGEFLILGDWFRRFTCARLRGGALELLTWPLAD